MVSIIIPVYNVQDYLKRCMESILSQTYRDIEIILIDDGSTDNSGSICDYYMNLDSRVKSIHKDNGGVSSARNAGIEVANGEYVMFVDPDDYISNEMINNMVDKMNQESVDLVECSYSKFHENNQHLVIKKERTGLIDTITALRYFLNWNGSVSAFCWGKLYRGHILKKMCFNQQLVVGEDALFVFDYIKRCNTVYLMNDPFYKYYLRANSAIGNKYTSRRIDAINSAALIRENCIIAFPELRSEANAHLGLATFYTCSSLVNTISLREFKAYKKDLTYIKKYFNMTRAKDIYINCGACTSLLWTICKISPLLYKMTLPLRNGRR